MKQRIKAIDIDTKKIYYFKRLKRAAKYFRFHIELIKLCLSNKMPHLCSIKFEYIDKIPETIA